MSANESSVGKVIRALMLVLLGAGSHALLSHCSAVAPEAAVTKVSIDNNVILVIGVEPCTTVLP